MVILLLLLLLLGRGEAGAFLARGRGGATITRGLTDLGGGPVAGINVFNLSFFVKILNKPPRTMHHFKIIRAKNHGYQFREQVQEGEKKRAEEEER